MSNPQLTTVLQLENIAGLDVVYYETLARLGWRIFNISDGTPLEQAISMTAYEVLTELGKVDLMIETDFTYLITSLSEFYYELIEKNATLLENFESHYLITNILYYTYTDEVMNIGVEAYPLC